MSCTFARYHASPWEQWWSANIQSIGPHWHTSTGSNGPHPHTSGCEMLCDGPCTLRRVVENRSHAISVWLDLQKQREAHEPAIESSVTIWHEHPLVSYHAVSDRCSDTSGANALSDSMGTALGGSTVRLVPIEPLVGPLRHPYHDCVKKSSTAQSKDFLLPSWRSEVAAWRVAVQAPAAQPKSFFFDCGASLYNAGSGGASQSWFVNGYAKRGLAFDRVLAWEYENHTDVAIRQQLPPALRARMRIYRDPHADSVRAGCCAADGLSYFNFGIDGAIGSHRNPLTHLRAIATPADFVVLKLDVDNPAIELSIVEQILGDASLARLIDEFYWEHVVRNSPMERFGWGHDLHRMKPADRQNLHDSYRYFGRLREMGIRAHSWV